MASALPIVSINIESSIPIKLPNDSTLSTEADNKPTTANLVVPLDSVEEIDLSPKMESASSNADENPSRNGGKSTANHALNSATDRKAGNSASSSAEIVNPEQPKFELIPSGHTAQGIAASISPAPSSKEVSGEGNNPPDLATPLLKGDSQSDAANASNADGRHQPTVVQSAQLVSQIGKADVKIALQGEQFGAVELHAKVTGDQVSASITVDRHEAHALLSGDLPVLHQVLNERQIQVSEIILLHNSLSSSSSADGGPPPKDHETSSQKGSGASGNASEGLPFISSSPSSRIDATGIFDSRGRLSVRA
jgi:flagellar hook-length control protein FliK